MFDGRFVGFADFLVLEDAEAGDRYRLRDTKLARSVKVEALLQLAAYADTLAARRRAGGRRGRAGPRRRRRGELPGRRAAAGLPAAAGRAAAAARRPPRRRRAGVVGGRGASAPASAAPSAPSRCARTTTCCWSPGMRVSQRARLLDAGVTTLHAARRAHAARCPNCRPARVNALTAQARLQVADARRRQAALRGGRRPAADGAARRRQGRPVLRLRGRPAVDASTAASGAWNTCGAC